MKIIGLTGSIGMGKTTVGKMFSKQGVPVHDSDVAAHKALQKSSPVFNAIVTAFPESVHKKTKKIDRKKLGKIVFSDPEKKQYLESLIHPFVQAEQKKFIKEHRIKGRKLVVLDIPLLYETGADLRVDKVAVVSAPLFIQAQRVLARPNMTTNKFNAILRAQMPDKEKCARADYVVQTGLGLARTNRQIRAIVRDIQKMGKYNERDCS